MAVYTQRKPPPRTRRTSRSRRALGEMLGLLLRRKKKVVRFRTQAVVNGAQRIWKLKRISRSTGLLIALAGALLAAGWLSYQGLIQTGIFRLTDIRIYGARVATERQIMDLSGLQQGTSLLRFRPQTVARAITAHPWVERAEVKLLWPSGVSITVYEQQPLALVNLERDTESRLRYLNREGVIFADIGPDQDIDFPVITGLQPERDYQSDRLLSGSLGEAAHAFLLLAAKGNAILPVQAVSEVHLDEHQGIVVYLVDQPFPIKFGRERMQTKYFRLVRVLEQLYTKKLIDAVKEIDMDYADDKVLVVGAKVDE